MDFHWPLVFHSPLLYPPPVPTLPPESQLFPHPENTPRHGCHLRSRGRGPIDPNWKCHFSALPNCQDVHPTLDRGAERAALSCTNCTALRAALYPSKHTHTHILVFAKVGRHWEGRSCVWVKPECKEPLNSSPEIEVTARQWTKRNRLLQNL